MLGGVVGNVQLSLSLKLQRAFCASHIHENCWQQQLQTRKRATAQEQHAHAWGLSAQRAIKEHFSFKSRL